ncbi:MAG: hypothetical protein ABEK84_05535 [Salinibacter sp.]
MNTSFAASTAPKASTYAHPPFSQRTRSLRKVQGCTSPRDSGSGTDGWARRAGQEDASEGEAEGPTAEVGSTKTVAVFRAALRRSDDGASPADLRKQASEQATPDSLEYFIPAFHRVLDRADRAERDAVETEHAEKNDESSLEYFAPAFRRGLGTTQELDEEVVDERGDGSECREAPDASTPSLEYFEPAFRRVLGQGRGRGAEMAGDDDSGEEGRKIMKALGTVVKDVSEQGRMRLLGAGRHNALALR